MAIFWRYIKKIMGVKIICQNKEILDIKNAVFAAIYYNVIDYIDDTNQQLSINLENLISQLYAATGGTGLDIADYVKNKNDAMAFANLIKIGIEKEQSGASPFNSDVEKTLQNFYKSILDYANKLPLSLDSSKSLNSDN